MHRSFQGNLTMIRMTAEKKKERKRRLTAPEVLAMQKLCHERIISDIHANKTSPGMPLPGIRILSKQYNIPLSVIRSTLDDLKNEGILEAIPREGVRLRSVPPLPASLKGKRFVRRFIHRYEEIENYRAGRSRV